MIGLAIEAATEHIEVLVCGPEGKALAHEVEEVGHGHTRRLTPLVAQALDRSGAQPRELRWVAADLGPGSFTGVRVGLATAQALALASGARVAGASSLVALALGAPVRRALVCPLVPAGRRDAYAGFFRADGRGRITLAAAPRVGDREATLQAIDEVLGAMPPGSVQCVGPGVPRWRDALEAQHAGSTALAWRFDGLSAHDLWSASTSSRGPAAGLLAQHEPLRPVYVRSAQAEERVRHRFAEREPVALRPFRPEDVPRVATIERRVFADPWPESFFRGELDQSQVYARVAERDGLIVGYSVAWLDDTSGHLGNLAVVPEQRRRGVARVLLVDLLARAERRGVERITLEVRVSNFAAQGLYRAHGFRLAGLRRGYYRDTGEDALLMEWRPRLG